MTKKQVKKPVKHFLITLFIQIVSRFSFAMTRRCGKALGYLLWIMGGRSKKISAKNIELCFPEKPLLDRNDLLKQSYLHSGMLVFESAWIWKASNDAVLSKIIKVNGYQLIEGALAKGNGLILTGPHLGNWEALLTWGGINLPSSVVYRMPKIEEMDDLLREARLKSGVELILGERQGVRAMLKKLKQGEVFMVLSDQNPAKGSGVFANFFHRPAYTMVLIQRLIEKTNAELLSFFAKRVEGGFEIFIEKPAFNSNEPDPTLFANGLNETLADQIKQAPEQFEWSYRRFRPQPDHEPSVYENL